MQVQALVPVLTCGIGTAGDTGGKYQHPEERQRDQLLSTSCQGGKVAVCQIYQ